MTIRIIETSEIKEIRLTDPRSNCDWSGDFIGNNVNDAKFDGEGIMIMSQENFDWWKNQAAEYGEADAAVYELLNGADSAEEEIKKDQLKELYHDYINEYEFIEQPGAMIIFIKENEIDY